MRELPEGGQPAARRVPDQSIARTRFELDSNRIRIRFASRTSKPPRISRIVHIRYTNADSVTCIFKLNDRIQMGKPPSTRIIRYDIVELVFLLPVALLGVSLDHFHGANAPDVDYAVEVVGWVRPRVGHDDHDLRDMARVLYPLRTGDVLVGEDAHLLFVLEKNEIAFIHHYHVQLVEEFVAKGQLWVPFAARRRVYRRVHRVCACGRWWPGDKPANNAQK